MVASQMPCLERRVAVRQLSDWEARCERISGASDQIWWFAQVRDLSATGIGLLIRQRFEPGTKLLIELVSPEGRRVQRFRGQVVHATPEQDRWLVGCAFERIDESAEVTNPRGEDS